MTRKEVKKSFQGKLRLRSRRAALHVCLTAQFDQLHPIQQGGGDAGGGVGRGDEEHLAEVERHAQVVIDEGAVLLRIQHLQQSGRRVALNAARLRRKAAVLSNRALPGARS